MPRFEERKINPAENPREAYEKTEEDEASLKAQLEGAKNADEIMTIATKLKGIEGTKKDMADTAHEEATKEEEERKIYDEAKKEDTERMMYAEAKAEDAERIMHDEAKAEDAARTEVKESAKALDAELENLRSQLTDKTPDEMLDIATKMKEVETKKTELQLIEDKQEYNEILEKIKGDQTKELEIKKIIDKMPIKSGMYMGNYLTFDVPEELLSNEQFLLKVAEVNPAAAYDHASKNLQGSKEFILKLMKAQPREETDKVNYHRVDFYTIEQKAPQFLSDKELAMALIKGNQNLGSMRAEMLKDKEIYNAAAQKEIEKIIDEAKDVANRKSGSYVSITDFKLRDNRQTLGGDRAKIFEQDQEFMEKVKKAASEFVNVSLRKGQLYFEPKEK